VLTGQFFCVKRATKTTPWISGTAHATPTQDFILYLECFPAGEYDLKARRFAGGQRPDGRRRIQQELPSRFVFARIVEVEERVTVELLQQFNVVAKHTCKNHELQSTTYATPATSTAHNSAIFSARARLFPTVL
jgi:hypothetical protein